MTGQRHQATAQSKTAQKKLSEPKPDRVKKMDSSGHKLWQFFQ
jgi:hypothetical protein